MTSEKSKQKKSQEQIAGYSGFPARIYPRQGNKRELGGVQSRLFFTIMRLLEECPKENKPKFVIAENVKNLLSIGRGFDFARVLLEMGKAGCNRIEWQVLNSKNFGVPQNRERIIIVGYLGNGCPRKIFPFRGEIVNVVKQIANISTRRNRRNPSQGRCYSTKGIAPTLCGNSGGQLQPCIFVKDVCRLGGVIPHAAFIDLSSRKPCLTKVARCLKARYAAGITNLAADNSGLILVE